MKKLFSRAKQPVQKWETWEDSSEYDWDRSEEADEMPAEEEPESQYAEEDGGYRRRGAGRSGRHAGGRSRQGRLEEDVYEPPEDGNAGTGWLGDDIEEDGEADSGHYMPEGFVEKVPPEAGYYGRREMGAGAHDRREEAVAGAYGRRERAEAGYYEEDADAEVYGGEEDAAAGAYAEEDAGEYGQEGAAAEYYEQEETTAGYYGQEETAAGDYKQEEITAGYYEREETAGGYYAEEEAVAGGYGQEEIDNEYYGAEEADSVLYGQEGQKAAYDGQEEAVYYAREAMDPAPYEEEAADDAYYVQETGEPLHYSQEEPDDAAYALQEDFTGYSGEAGLAGEDAPYQREVYDGEEAYAEPPVSKRERHRAEWEETDEAPEEGILARFARSLRGMELMDKVMLGTGAVVLILAVVTVVMFASARIVKNQVADFANVGLQLEGISVIGEKGLMAVADARMEKLASAVTPEPQEPQETEEPKKDYNEIGYDRQVSVEPGFTSIQKDLKIKFINTKTDKLVPNVPFSVTVTAPDGKTLIWSDDDMDGIIYKQDIAPGTYQVAMETLTDNRYAGYTISTASKSVEVKKEISYNKVDVANEVKKESEVDAAKEDTRKNETVVESSLQDTVAWVESKTVESIYSEVPKSTIPDPATLTIARRYRRTAGVQLLSQEQAEPQAGQTRQAEPQAGQTRQAEPQAGQGRTGLPQEPAGDSSQVPGGDSAQLPADSTPDSASASTQPTAEPTQEPTAVPTQEPTAVPTLEPTAVPTLEPTAVPTQEPTAVPTLEPTAVPTQEPTAVPTQDPTAVPTQLPTAEPTWVPTSAPTPVVTPVPSPTPFVTPIPARGTLTIDHTSLSGGTGVVLTAKASAGGFDQGRTIYYSAVTNNPAVATASVDQSGNVTVYTVAAGTAVITVTANYEGGGPETAVSAGISVSVGGGAALALDISAVTMSVQGTTAIHALITNSAVQDQTVRAESSNTNVAAVSVDKKTVTITGIAEGTAVITVKYAENGSEASASCTVTVKRGPREDRTTLLKDAEGRQLYVVDNNTYREAVYADYYTAEKFFIRGEAKYTGWQTIDGRLYYFTAEGNKVTGEQVIQGAKYHFASDGSLVTGDGTLGIDVSKWNGTIDWNAVKNSGVSYVIIRCGYRGSSEGKLIEDPKFEANIKGASSAGLKVGIYFFTQAVNEIEAVEEASMVLGQIKNYRISYPVFLDVEASGGRGDKIDKSTRTAVCRAFCQTIQNAGYTAGIYANKQWLEGKLDAGSLGSFKIWLAQYAAAPTYTGRYDLWQYKATGSISGISGNVDLNISYLGY